MLLSNNTAFLFLLCFYVVEVVVVRAMVTAVMGWMGRGGLEVVLNGNGMSSILKNKANWLLNYKWSSKVSVHTVSPFMWIKWILSLVSQLYT